MITARMVGRVARDSKVSANEYGKFVSFELNMFDYYKGQNYITWGYCPKKVCKLQSSYICSE